MGRRPAKDTQIPRIINGVVFEFPLSTITPLPQAPAFVEALLAKGLQAHVAIEYARLVAKAIRDGVASTLESITARNMRTAVNAYWEWVNVSYTTRVQPVLRAFASTGSHVREGFGQIRRSSLVPPFPGKTVPRLVRFNNGSLDPETKTVVMPSAPTMAWEPCDTWTLHVPVAPNTPPHQDPCATCAVIPLDVQLLEVLAVAFEKTWGSRDLNSVPPETLFFGEPPREGKIAEKVRASAGRIVALVQPGALRDALTRVGAICVDEPGVFVERLGEGADVVVVTKARVDESVRAAVKTWGER